MSDYTCAECGGENIQLLMPVWMREDLETVVSVDFEADPLGYYCDDCDDHVKVKSAFRDGTVAGRWSPIT